MYPLFKLRCGQTQAHSVICPSINFFCLIISQITFFRKNSHDSWCPEAMHFPIQAMMKPRIKCVAK